MCVWVEWEKGLTRGRRRRRREVCCCCAVAVTTMPSRLSSLSPPEILAQETGQQQTGSQHCVLTNCFWRAVSSVPKPVISLLLRRKSRKHQFVNITRLLLVKLTSLSLLFRVLSPFLIVIFCMFVYCVYCVETVSRDRIFPICLLSIL